MADEQHIKWIREGVSFWNRKRQDEDFTPDFSKADIPSILHPETSLKGINLEGGRFNEANLSGLDLEEANLRNAQLQFARLEKTNLAGATLESAKLGGADLRDAKLCPNFLDPKSKGVNISNADLRTANLTNADITLARPWEANLYGSGKNRIEHIPNLQERIESIDDLINMCQSFKTYYGDKSKEASCDYDWQFYYRGQENSSWDLRPSVMRISSGQTTNREKEGEMLLDLMSRRPEDFIGATSALSQWVLAQHHGLKTRLLDVTRNPLVALFHACENSPDSEDSNNRDGSLHIFAVPKHLIRTFDSDAISVVSNLAKLPREEQDLLMGKTSVDIEKFIQKHSPQELLTNYNYIRGRLYSYIRQEKPYFKERIDIRDLFRVFVVEPQQLFERIRVQSGAFLISAFHERFEEEKILDYNKDIPLYYHHEVVVPDDKKKDFLGKLQVLNVKREVLFPNLEEASDAIVKQYETSVNTTAFLEQ